MVYTGKVVGNGGTPSPIEGYSNPKGKFTGKVYVPIRAFFFRQLADPEEEGEDKCLHNSSPSEN